MLYHAAVLFLVAIIATVFGFSGIAAGIATAPHWVSPNGSRTFYPGDRPNRAIDRHECRRHTRDRVRVLCRRRSDRHASPRPENRSRCRAGAIHSIAAVQATLSSSSTPIQETGTGVSTASRSRGSGARCASSATSKSPRHISNCMTGKRRSRRSNHRYAARGSAPCCQETLIGRCLGIRITGSHRHDRSAQSNPAHAVSLFSREPCLSQTSSQAIFRSVHA